MLTKLKLWTAAHKFISALIVILIVGIGWYWYSTASAAPAVTKYVVEDATTGSVVASVSGSGQMQAVTTVDVKPQVTETVTKVLVQPGDAVAAGQALIDLDPTNEEQALTQAQLSMKSAQLSLDKLTEAPATTTLVQDEDSVTQAEENIVNASTSLDTDYQTGFDSLSSAFIDFQNVMAGIQAFVSGNDISKSQSDPDAYINLMPTYLQAGAAPYATNVQSSYAAAAAAYEQNLLDYHAASRNSSPARLDSLFSETYTTAQSISESVKAVKDLLNYVVDNYPTGDGYEALPAITTTFQTNMGNYTNTIDGDVSSISSAITSITNDKSAITNDGLTLAQASDTLSALVGGPDPLDVQTNQLSIEQEQLSLQTAQQNLADTVVRAPIAGTVSAMDAVVGEDVPSPAASIIGNSQEAVVTLNEIDAAKVAVGDPATLTFDALPDLSVAGQVIEVDPVGTVTQGVVNYDVDVSLATPNDQIKPGMSVTVNIVTQADQNVIAVPNAAIQGSGASAYVLEPATPLSSTDVSASAEGGILLPGGTKEVPVTTGLANDTMTEIDSGISVGDQIITQTIKTSASTASTASGGTSALRALTGGAGAGGGFTGGGGAAATGRTFTGRGGGG